MPAFVRFPSLSPDWTLARVDKEGADDALEGQFPPENEKLSTSANWVETPILSRAKPRQQWTGGNLARFSFQALLFSETLLDSLTSVVEKQFNKLLEWQNVDPEVGRPAILLYKCGLFEFTGRIDTIEYSIGERFPFSGAIKKVSAVINLVEVDDTPTGPVLMDPTKPPHLSLYRTVRETETFETIARDEYQDPIVGVFLRQDHLKAFPAVGDIVFLPKKTYFTRRPIAPDAYALSEAPAAVAARTALFALRSAPLNMPQVK